MDCPICIEPLFGVSKKSKVTSCGHIFHQDCIETHIRKRFIYFYILEYVLYQISNNDSIKLIE